MGAETKTILIHRPSHIIEDTTPFVDLSANRIQTEYDSDISLKNNNNNIKNNNIIKSYENTKTLDNIKNIDDDEDDIHPHHHGNINTGTEELGTDHTFKREIVWFNAIGFLMLHIVGVVGILTMLLGYTKLYTTIYFVILTYSSGMGVTAGAHRLFSHRAYKATTSLRVLLLLLHTMAGQNCLYVWVRDHRQHHKYSDTDADPHNATRGFFFSHVGWLMSKKHPKVLEYGKKLDMSDLEADPWIMFQKKYYKTLYTIFVILLPTAVPVYFWNENIILALLSTYIGRTVLQLNFTWSVNSVAHIWGNKPYDKNMLPVETTFVAIVAGGEGWHNYHHTFPFDYRAAELNMPYNVTTKLIDFWAKHGFAYDRKTVTDTMLKNRVLRTGDGTHHQYGTNANITSADETIKDDDSNSVFKKYIVDKNEINNLRNLNDINNNNIKLRQKILTPNDTLITKQALNI